MRADEPNEILIRFWLFTIFVKGIPAIYVAAVLSALPLIAVACDLTGDFWTRLIERMTWTKGAEDAEKEVQFGTDCHEATADRGAFGTRQGVGGGVPGSRDLAAELRDECLNQEIFYSLKQAQVVIEQWRRHYNTRRPHSALGYRPPAPAAVLPAIERFAEPSSMQ